MSHMPEPDPEFIHADETALFALAREWRNVQVVARFTIDGEPVSKARARFAGTKNGGTRAYTPAKTKTAEERVAWMFRQSAPGYGPPDATSAFGLFGIFFHGTNQRRDVDNMLKLLCDGLNGVAWKDDSQVDEIAGRRGFGPSEHARTEVLVYKVGTRMGPPQRPCANCGKTVNTYTSLQTKYCSRACNVADHRAKRMVTCAHCGKSFDGVKTVQRPMYCDRACSDAARNVELTCGVCGRVYNHPRSLARLVKHGCSEACRAAYWREHRKITDKGTCPDCGGFKSKRSYARCRSCSFVAAKTARAAQVIA